jgi:benzodiazapine receptor
MHTDQTAPGSHAMPPLPRFLVAVLPVVAVAVSASLITQPNIPTWYAGLAKPAFTPPNWAFPVAWTALYAMMAYALWRILSLPANRPGRAAAIVAFFVQLALNGLWSFAFFGGRSPIAGLVVIAALIVAILATIRTFWRLDRTAGLLLVPYLAWVAYATLLNGTIWRLNG